MLSQKRESRTSNVKSPKRVAVIDFSEYQEDGDILGRGAGIAIYEWPALAAFNMILVAEACQMASSLATETMDDLGKAVKLALYGLHWKEQKDLAATYLKWVGKPLVSEVIALIDPQPVCLVAHIKKSGATYAIFDTPGSNEKIYIHKVSNELSNERCKTAQRKKCRKTAQGKTHAVYISDIVAYYAALLSARLHYGGSRVPNIDKRIKKVMEMLKNYPVSIVQC
jgi:hypothetical protein